MYKWYVVDFMAQVAVKAEDEDAAEEIAEALLLDEDFDRSELDFFGFEAWEEE